MEIADLEQLERATQYEEDNEWVIVRPVQMTHPAIPCHDHTPTGEDIERDGNGDEETEGTHSSYSSIHSFQQTDDFVQTSGTGPEGKQEEGEQLSIPDMEIFPFNYSADDSTEERTPSEDEISLNLFTTVANDLEDENLFQHATPTPDYHYSDYVGQQMKRRRVDETETARRVKTATNELREIDLDTPKQTHKPRDDVLIKYHFMATFRLLHEQYQEIKAKLVEQIFTDDIWQTWEYISEEDRADQITVLRSDVLFRDYREGHCLNQDKFREEKNLVVFDSYLEQLVDLCCQQWTRDQESGNDSEVTPREMVPRKPEVLRQDVAEDICRNFMLVEPV